jgi:starvation-inducible DNA-binding protein
MTSRSSWNSRGREFVANMRRAHRLADEYDDIAAASGLETCIDGAERRPWFLFETSRRK